ncbi:hypothetical protein HNQ59_003281 [Chitinivorax tropicus]|uniref:Alpha/beta hydrolase n=1 Tax=Chitinivorax tropicus TaxID=714531 RepID=A0A840MUH2_9PROT|nr:alpha/beta hydrolase [Chitinivorax tropicus]MBB5019973.1 hypothetical protein [Chitinivorax tropicus]
MVAATILIVPGLYDSGPLHWQTRWEQRLPQVARVRQQSWSVPIQADWVATLAAQLAAIDGPVVLAAHSLGCITAVHLAAAQGAGQIVGALLVAPADVERDNAPPVIRNFAPIPRVPLPFTSLVVASDDDPYCTLSRSQAFASDWGAKLITLPGAGHINGDSGLGEWEDGLVLLNELVHEAQARIAAG